MVKSILENAGYKVGLIGTIEAIIGDKVIPAKNTTPESYVIQEYFHEMAEAGCDCVVMEVSSQGLMTSQNSGICFRFWYFYKLLSRIISDQMNIRILMIISDANLCCSSSVVWESSTEMMNTLRELSKGIPVSWKLYGFSPEADLRAEDAHMVGGKGYLGISYQLKGLMEFRLN